MSKASPVSAPMSPEIKSRELLSYAGTSRKVSLGEREIMERFELGRVEVVESINELDLSRRTRIESGSENNKDGNSKYSKVMVNLFISRMCNLR